MSHSMKSATISRSSPLAAPKRSNLCWRLTESVPPGPAPPESHSATAVTVLLVISTGTISGGRSRYKSRLATVGERAFGCLVRSTSITLHPVFVHRSAG